MRLGHRCWVDRAYFGLARPGFVSYGRMDGFGKGCVMLEYWFGKGASEMCKDILLLVSCGGSFIV